MEFETFNLKKVIFIKFLEHAAFDLDKVVAHHDCDEGRVASIDGHVESGGLEQEQH